MSTGKLLKPSKVLAKLRAGETAFATKMNLADPRAAEIAAFSGFDCIWTCQEHIGNDYAVIQNQILAAKAWGCDTVCRVPKGSYSDYVKPLELDATGIMVPHLMSAAEAKNIVKMTRFHPVGRRPLDGGNADGLYCQVPQADYLEHSNKEKFIILQIEDPEPLDELDEIASVSGYDMLFFGPGDFSHSIGDPGNFANPQVLEARKRVADTARKYGKFAGTVGSLANVKELIEMGYNFINIGADVIFLAEGYKKIIGTLREMPSGKNKSIYSGE